MAQMRLAEYNDLIQALRGDPIPNFQLTFRDFCSTRFGDFARRAS
jgi:hypothetical protein